jgi:hypothetical protein
MKIKKFNESYDENSNRLDIDTLLDILLEITDELDGLCEVVLCSANGYCSIISQDFDITSLKYFKFFLNDRGWSFRVNYPISSFHLYAKLINVLDPLIQRINDMGWSVNEFGNSKGFLDTEVLLNSIHFTFKPQ